MTSHSMPRTNMRQRSVLALLVGVLTGACTADTLDRADSEAPVLTRDAQVVSRICADPDADGCTLGQLIDAVPLNGGRTLVAHVGSPLFIYDSLGALLDSAGRFGRGPGEFESIVRVAQTAGDSIGVVDMRGLRVVTRLSWPSEAIRCDGTLPSARSRIVCPTQTCLARQDGSRRLPRGV